jgi:hypothetical protein
MNDVTILLAAASHGDPNATGKSLPLVYEELRRLAAQRPGNEALGQKLQPTALVHEAYPSLTGNDGAEKNWYDRGHFFASAAEAMRRVLVTNLDIRALRAQNRRG